MKYFGGESFASPLLLRPGATAPNLPHLPVRDAIAADALSD